MREKEKQTILVWGRKREKILENVLNNSKWEREREQLTVMEHLVLLS